MCRVSIISYRVSYCGPAPGVAASNGDLIMNSLLPTDIIVVTGIVVMGDAGSHRRLTLAHQPGAPLS